MAAVVTLSRSFTRRFVSYKWTTSTTCIVGKIHLIHVTSLETNLSGQNTSRLTAKHFGSRDLCKHINKNLLHDYIFTATSPILQSSAGKHWLSERGVSVALLALIPAGLMYPTPIIDYSIALILPLHIHW